MTVNRRAVFIKILLRILGDATSILIDGVVKDVDKSFVVYPKDAGENPLFVNWPELIASRESPETNLIFPLYGEINGRAPGQWEVTKKGRCFKSPLLQNT